MTPPPRYTMGPHIPGWERTYTYSTLVLREAVYELGQAAYPLIAWAPRILERLTR